MGTEKATQPEDQDRGDKKLYRAFGEAKSMKEWLADPRCTLTRNGIYKRLARGLSFEEAIGQPPPGIWTVFGEAKSKREWLKDPRCKVNKSALDNRIQQGMTLEAALTTPVPNWRGPRVAFGEWKTVAEWLQDSRCVVSSDTLLSRLQREWDLEIALTTPTRKLKTRPDRGECVDKVVPASDEPVLEAFGETRTMSEWASDARCLVNLTRLRDRLRTGWNLEAAITTPAKENIIIEAFGEQKTLLKWACDPRCAVARTALYRRIELGMSPEEALLTPRPERSGPWKISAFGETKSLQGWSKDPRCAVTARGLQSRLQDGEHPEEAITRPPSHPGPGPRKHSEGFW